MPGGDQPTAQSRSPSLTVLVCGQATPLPRALLAAFSRAVTALDDVLARADVRDGLDQQREEFQGLVLDRRRQLDQAAFLERVSRLFIRRLRTFYRTTF